MIGKIDSLLARLGDYSRDLVWLLFRLMVSSMFMTHGFAELFGENPQPFRDGGITAINIGEVVSYAVPMEINMLFIAGVIEFFGGALIFIGLWTHLAAFLAVALMLMAYLTTHLAWYPTLNNGEIPTMYFFAFLLIFCAGAGPTSLDALLEERKSDNQQKKIDALARS